MNTDRTSALIVGILFIVATLFFMIGQSIYSPFVGSQDYLENAHPNRLVIIFGVLVEIIGVLAIPLIAIYILPILRKHNQGLAVVYVVFRSIEALLLLLVSIYTISLIEISHGFLDLADANINLFQEIGGFVQALGKWTFLLSVGIVFPITAIILNIVLYKSMLVPRFISIWGFIGAVILLLGTLLDLFDLFTGIPNSTLEAILTIPIAVNEMVLAFWLIFKGFNLELIIEDHA